MMYPEYTPVVVEVPCNSRLQCITTVVCIVFRVIVVVNLEIKCKSVRFRQLTVFLLL